MRTTLHKSHLQTVTSSTKNPLHYAKVTADLPLASRGGPRADSRSGTKKEWAQLMCPTFCSTESETWGQKMHWYGVQTSFKGWKQKWTSAALNCKELHHGISADALCSCRASLDPGKRPPPVPARAPRLSAAAPP